MIVIKDLQTKLNELTNNDLKSLKQNIVKTSKKNGVVYILGNGLSQRLITSQ